MRSNTRLPRALTSLVLFVAFGLTAGYGAPAAEDAPESRIQYGFFPTPPEPTAGSVQRLYADMHVHGDFVLLQENIPWSGFLASVDGTAQTRAPVVQQVALARRNRLGMIFVVDPLDGLNRRAFQELPADWTPSFDNPSVRAAYEHFALWIARTYRPEYLGLASEINTYLDAHPAETSTYLSLYRETYAQVKRISPQTKVFVTFQWEDLNNLAPFDAEGRSPEQTDWNEMRMFEPDLDVWAISTYPFVSFPSAAAIPGDYYTRLSSVTSKPLAVSEGGYPTKPSAPFSGGETDQKRYLQAIHDQIGTRLLFWCYLLLDDFDGPAYVAIMRAQGQSSADRDTLGLFTSVGLRTAGGDPKPALAYWDAMRAGNLPPDH